MRDWQSKHKQIWLPKKNLFALLASEDDNSQPMSEREEDDDDDLTRLLPLVIGQALIERVPGFQINVYFEVMIPCQL